MKRVIATAMANRQPAYIMVAQDMAEMPITGPAVEPYSELESDTDELKAAVEAGGEAAVAGELKEFDQLCGLPFAPEKANAGGQTGVAVQCFAEGRGIERLTKRRVPEVRRVAAGTAQGAAGDGVDERDFVGDFKGSDGVADVAKGR